MSDFCVWEGIFPDYGAAEAEARGDGFASDTWVGRSREAFIAARQALEAGEGLPESVTERAYILPQVTASLLAVQDKVSILDFGGGYGTASALSLKAGLGANAARVSCDILELKDICEQAPLLYAGMDAPRFISELPGAGTRYDIIHAGSVLQYVGDWRGLVRAFAAMSPQILLLSDVFVGDIPSFATLQNYYGSRIAQWLLNEGEFVQGMEAEGYRLVYREPYAARILGVKGSLPMDNFPPAYRLRHTGNFMFARNCGI